MNTAPIVLVCAAGLWRGSTVAVKTMILPARMSGAEKRERMAIMEAAISSTMAHPNIVQVSSGWVWCWAVNLSLSGICRNRLFIAL